MNHFECGDCHAMNSPEDGTDICFHCGARMSPEMEIDDGLEREIVREYRADLERKDFTDEAFQMNRLGSVF